LEARRNLPGIRFDLELIRAELQRLEPFAGELTSVFGPEKRGNDPFWFHNHSYEDFDAVTLYAELRLRKPRRVIEAGCGFSSRVINLATARNAAEGAPCECHFIEPYLDERFLDAPPVGTVHEKKLEDMPASFFEQLEAGDVLFLDTSHVVKAGNDCTFEYTELLPSLSPGVLIHIHDIFTPYNYPADWLFERQYPFNEQYIVEGLLSGGDKYRIVLPLYLLWSEHRVALDRLMPNGTARPGAFWVEKIG
jgi:hypothetical protein